MLKIFPGILLGKSAKITRPLIPLAVPNRPRCLVPIQQVIGTRLQKLHDGASRCLAGFLRSPRKIRHYGYRGLKIFNSLTLCFQNFHLMGARILSILSLFPFSSLVSNASYIATVFNRSTFSISVAETADLIFLRRYWICCPDNVFSSDAI